jgi:cell wall-associated NlpC family hydrolase
MGDGRVRERVRVEASPAIDLARLDSCERTSWIARAWRPLMARVPSTRPWRHSNGDDLTVAAAQDDAAIVSGGSPKAAGRPTIDVRGYHPTSRPRRRRLSGARRIDADARTDLQASLTRAGLHGLMVAVGLTVALTVWNGAGERLQWGEAGPGAVVEIGTGDALTEIDGEVVTLAEDTENAASAAGAPLQPLVRTVVEGDTLRSIAAEFSVSISTILASNRFDDPDLIRVGQEIVIPPVDGVVTDVKPGETLGQLAERFGVTPEDVAQANALADDPDRTIPYERIVVPGKETADRAIGIARREGAGNAVGSVDPDDVVGPGTVTYEVQEGDTVGQLATQFGVSIWTILSANSLSDPDLIRPGTRLKVLAVNGVEHEIQEGENLADIAEFYKVDLGPLIDFNAISDPDNLRVGSRLTIPGAERAQPGFSLARVGNGALPGSAAVASPANVAAAQRSAVQSTLAAAKPQTQAKPQAQVKPATQAAAKLQAKPQAQAKPATQAAAKPQAPASQGTNRLQAAAISAPTSISSGASVVSAAMRHLGARYVFGGTSPAGFDCSGYVWYVHKAMGRPVSRGLWGQLNGGPRVALSALQPGDTVFFANTYMPGLSHVGIYIGGGRFVHASDEASGVKISSLSDSYWGPRYIGASRLY